MTTQFFATVIAAAAATSLLSFSASAQAAALTSTNFGTEGIRFNTDTTVDFKLLETRGMFQSFLGLYTADGTLQTTLFTEDLRNADPGTSNYNQDWLGTLGTTYSNNLASFTFLADTEYFFGLTKVGQTTPYSFSPTSNTAKFLYDGGTYTYNAVGPTWIADNPGKEIPTNTINITPGRVLVAMEDGVDADYNDLIFEAKKASVPEPSLTLALIGVGSTALAGIRRRRHSSVS